MASIRDIAQKTGLSIATISRYMNSSGYVSKQATEIIEEAIKQFDYIPNAHAKAIFNKRSNTIGIVFPSLVNPFFAQMSTILGNCIQAAGYSSILCFTEDRADKEKEAIDLLRSYRVGGMIICRGVDTNLADKVNFPVVSFETPIAEGVVTVAADNYSGGVMAFEHLYAQGCRKILHLKGPNQFCATENRCKGFVEAAAKVNLAVDVMEIFHDYTLNQQMEDELKAIDFRQYDGLFVFNDVTCLVILHYLEKNGISCPQDIRAIGFDNTYLTCLVGTQLTTIEQPVEEIAHTCFDTLMALMRGEKIAENEQIVPVHLVVRRTA